VKTLIGFGGWALVTFAAGAVGAFASRNAPSFYAQLVKPAWAPPSWLFGPVWTALYVMMAVAAWLVWRKVGWRGAGTALGLFLAQLACNALWSWCFFAWRRGALAFGEIIVLLALLVACVVAFARVDRIAALLLAPYLAWVSFATALTLAIWRANPDKLG
jgi:translocator protein